MLEVDTPGPHANQTKLKVCPINPNQPENPREVTGVLETRENPHIFHISTPSSMFHAGDTTRRNLAASLHDIDGDLGNEEEVDELLRKVSKGEGAPGVKVMRSRQPEYNKKRDRYEMSFEGRTFRPSTKNLQLQVCGWYGFRVSWGLIVISKFRPSTKNLQLRMCGCYGLRGCGLGSLY